MIKHFSGFSNITIKVTTSVYHCNRVKMSTFFLPAKHSVLGGGPLAPRLDRRGGIGGIDGRALGVVAAASTVVQMVFLIVVVECDRRRHWRWQRWSAVMVVVVIVVMICDDAAFHDNSNFHI